MPIRIPDRLPAAKTLKDENIFVMTEQRAMGQDIRPLKILLLNLMPTKIATETQLSRLLSNTPLQVELELIAPRDHVPKNTPQEHMLAFYRHFDDVRDSNYDGMVITGAPVEHLPFEEVGYWPELCEILEWSKSHVHSTFHICWGAQAGLYYHYGIQKQPLEKKLFGVFPHIVERRSNMLFRGSDDVFMVPHSRHTTILREDVESRSREAGIYALSTESGRQIFITGHSEYDADTLDQEYRRDKSQGKPIGLPQHYYPGDDDTKPPRVTWRSCANLLYSNWLNYFVYQTTPYDLSDLPPQGGRQNPAECKKEEGSNHG